MVSLEELGIVIPLITSIIIPIVIIGLSRYLRGSDALTRSSLIAEQRLREIEADVKTIQDSYKEIWDRLATLEKAVYNTCWRLDKIEKEHEQARAD